MEMVQKRFRDSTDSDGNKENKKFRFSVNTDTGLLREILEARPFATPHGEKTVLWHKISERMRMQGQNTTARAVHDRYRTLLKSFKNPKFLKKNKSDFTERDVLIHELMHAIQEHDSKKGKKSRSQAKFVEDFGHDETSLFPEHESDPKTVDVMGLAEPVSRVGGVPVGNLSSIDEERLAIEKIRLQQERDFHERSLVMQQRQIELTERSLRDQMDWMKQERDLHREERDELLKLIQNLTEQIGRNG